MNNPRVVVYYPGTNIIYWKATSGARVEVLTSGQLQAHAFNDTQESMNQVEDPNQEFPPGHYLPFPIAVAEISNDRDFFFEICIY